VVAAASAALHTRRGRAAASHEGDASAPALDSTAHLQQRLQDVDEQHYVAASATAAAAQLSVSMARRAIDSAKQAVAVAHSLEQIAAAAAQMAGLNPASIPSITADIMSWDDDALLQEGGSDAATQAVPDGAADGAAPAAPAPGAKLRGPKDEVRVHHHQQQQQHQQQHDHVGDGARSTRAAAKTHANRDAHGAKHLHQPQPR
jgi:hypothetical protein